MLVSGQPAAALGQLMQGVRKTHFGELSADSVPAHRNIGLLYRSEEHVVTRLAANLSRTLPSSD